MFESVRWAAIKETPRDDWFGTTISVQQHVRDRYAPGDFYGPLYNRFEDPEVEYASSQRFIRRFDDGRIVDFLEANEDQPNRIRLVRPLDYGTGEWARLSRETDISHLVDSLDGMAALLAVYGLHHPRIGCDFGNCTVTHRPDWPEPEYQLRINEVSPKDAEVRRTFWVDHTSGYSVTRYRGTTPELSVQIDLEYSSGTGQGHTNGWTVSVSGAEHEPVLGFVTSVVDSMADTVPSEVAELDKPADVPHGSRVVDEVSGAEYLVRPDGTRRDITQHELKYHPTYEELLDTETGELAALIESRSRWRKYLSEYGYLIAIAVFSFGIAAVIKLKQRLSTNPVAAARQEPAS